MDILLVSATEGEIGPFKARLGEHWSATGDGVYERGNVRLTLQTTGVGSMATAYALTKALCTQQYDLVLQAGIGGSFDRDISLGSVVLVASDRYGDMGAEDHDNYLDVFDMGLIQANSFPYENGVLPMPETGQHSRIKLPRVSALTVNMVSGNARSIERLSTCYGCQVESMEGAALHYVCLMEQVPFAQVRAISNYVTPRDRGSWKMKEAVIALNEWLADFLENI